jgi:nucleotide-binding universal stress UspA family protein
MTTTTPPTILVGLDSSPRAPAVLAAAVDIAQHYGATLVALRAVEVPRGVPTQEPLATEDGRAEALFAAARLELDAQLAQVPAGLGARGEVRAGEPVEVLCELAAETHARFVVIGAHGHSAWRRALGTTAARLLEAARTSVVAVRDPSDAAE